MKEQGVVKWFNGAKGKWIYSTVTSGEDIFVAFLRYSGERVQDAERRRLGRV